MICLTLDTDWVPEEVLKYVLDILHNKGAKATVFATGYYACLTNVDEELIEVGIHPNIKQLDRVEEIIVTLKEIYPRAVSLRNHSLVHSSRFWPVYKKQSIKNTSNFFMPHQPYLAPFKYMDAVTEHPIYFMDDYYLNAPESTFKSEDLNLVSPGLKVLAFHPIHIYLNSISMAHYNQAKPYLKNMQALTGYRNTDNRGIEQLFIDLINHFHNISKPIYKLCDIPLRLRNSL